MRTCKNCDRPIEKRGAPEGSKLEDNWVHVSSQIGPCALGMTGEWAEPKEDEDEKS